MIELSMTGQAVILFQQTSLIVSFSRHLLTSDRTFSTSVYTPGIEDVMSNFHVSTTVAILPLTVYVLGLGFGPVLAAPLSESRGRKFAYMLSIPLFAIFTLGAGFSQNITTLIILRFLAGVFGSP